MAQKRSPPIHTQTIKNAGQKLQQPMSSPLKNLSDTPRRLRHPATNPKLASATRLCSTTYLLRQSNFFLKCSGMGISILPISLSKLIPMTILFTSDVPSYISVIRASRKYRSAGMSDTYPMPPRI